MQTELEASFIYEDTPDQSKANGRCKKDMELPSPMDRLVCGMWALAKQRSPSGPLLKPVAMANRLRAGSHHHPGFPAF